MNLRDRPHITTDASELKHNPLRSCAKCWCHGLLLGRKRPRPLTGDARTETAVSM